MFFEISSNLADIVQEKSVSLSIYEKRMVKAVRNTCNAKRGATMEYYFKDQKATIMLFGGDGTYPFTKKASRDFETEKSSPFPLGIYNQPSPSLWQKIKLSKNPSICAIIVTTFHWLTRLIKISFPVSF